MGIINTNYYTHLLNFPPVNLVSGIGKLSILRNITAYCFLVVNE